MWTRCAMKERAVTCERTMRLCRVKNVTSVNKIVESLTIAVLLISVYIFEGEKVFNHISMRHKYNEIKYVSGR